RAGGGVSKLLGPPPWTVGWDVAGIVEAVGPGVTRFAPGDEVHGMPRFPHPARGYAGFVTCPSRHLARKPEVLEMVEAAALPLAGLTAWQALVDTARLEAGQRVLIHAAAGGVGHLAAQIAKAVGAEVIGTARAAKHDFLRRIGVDEPVDYTAVDVGDVVGGVDVVLDCVGGDAGRRSLPCLRPGGMLIVVPSASDPGVLVEARERGLRATGILVEPDYASLERLDALVAEGKLRPEIDTVLPLAEAAKAHEIGEQGRTQGKLVLRTG
ncbi:MAG TPA: NADP-dependent oxidoreductase, partial [Acidimicrobiia bacterium]|nr:NADP-dependent oxidoreductase [Acidimicrobiia bacterium]